jgi:hypothetical protein
MTDESRAKLLQAYKFAVEADQDGIADLLEGVILDVMDGERTSSTVIEPRNTLEPPWRVEATPLFVPGSYTVDTTVGWIGIDHTTREVTS